MAHRSSRRSVRDRARARRSRRRARALRGTSRLGTRARPRRLDRSRVAGRVRRSGCDAARAGDLLRGVRPRRRTGTRRHHRRGSARPDDRALRHRRPEAPGAARHSPGHRDLVPGLLRARRGFRPRERPDPRRSRRRRVGHQRAEGVDVARALGAVDLRDRAHRPRRAEAQGPVVSPRPDGPARAHRDPARSCRSPATASSTRRSSTGRAPPPPTSSAR